MVTRSRIRHAALTDLSKHGLRLERPFDPKTASRDLQLEIELPELDEVIWASGHVTFANLRPMGGRHENGQPRLWCSAGVKIDRLASAERRLIGDYVYELRRSQLSGMGWIDVPPL